MKARRQALILELIDREPLHSQEQLRRRLLQRGFEATQATISRDIKELGLVKRAGDGAYQRPGAEAHQPRDGARPRSSARPPSFCGASTACSSWSSSAPARARRSRWRWPSTARSCRKRSARSPATTRSS